MGEAIGAGSFALSAAPEGVFDASDPGHLARLDRLLDKVPQLFPGWNSSAPEATPDRLGQGARAVEGVLGRRLESAWVLTHTRQGVLMDRGHGPVELRFEGGAVVHTWPAGAGVALRPGPLPEHSVRWRDAAGRGNGLALERLGGAPTGGSLRRCWVALAGFFDLTPQGWQLGFGDRSVFCFSGSGRHREACVHIGAERPDFGFRSENWACHWRLLAEVGP